MNKADFVGAGGDKMHRVLLDDLFATIVDIVVEPFKRGGYDNGVVFAFDLFGVLRLFFIVSFEIKNFEICMIL